MEERYTGYPDTLQTGKTMPLRPAQRIEREFARAALPRRREEGHKGDFGRVLIVGGAVGYTGAPCLAAQAAERSGCGLVELGVPRSVWPIAAVKCTCAMPFPLPEEKGMLSSAALEEILDRLDRCDVLALGCGLGRGSGVREVVLGLLERAPMPVVLDADGINALAGHMDVLDKRRGRVTILTPHAGEFARIGGQSGEDRVSAARSFARDHGCILVLKGHLTVIAVPEGNALINTTGGSGLAKGGSGDVLTGLIAGLLAQGASGVMAAAGGVWIHGRAGDLASLRRSSYAMTPQDVIETLGEVFLEIQ